MYVRIVASLAAGFGMASFVGVVGLALHSHNVFGGMFFSLVVGFVSSLGLCRLDKGWRR